MIRTSAVRLIAATPLIAMLAACGTEQSGEAPEESAVSSEVPAEIAARQDNFEAIGDSFKVIREQLEGDADMAAIQEASADINTRLQRLPDFFPEGTSMEAGFETEALAVIWEDPDGFAEATQNAITASEGMMAAAATGDPAAVGEQAGNLGLNGCKACHDKFRVDDD